MARSWRRLGGLSGISAGVLDNDLIVGPGGSLAEEQGLLGHYGELEWLRGDPPRLMLEKVLVGLYGGGVACLAGGMRPTLEAATAQTAGAPHTAGPGLGGQVP